jgi:hypothetical protein
MSNTQLNASGLSPFSGFRNKIINGDMRIDQRNNGAVSGPGYCADRWTVSINATGGTATLQTGATGPNLKFPRALTITNTTSAVTSIVEHVSRQVFEVGMIRDLAGQKVSVSFWYKSNRTGLHGCRVIGAGPATSGTNVDIGSTFTVNTANTWEFKTLVSTAFAGVTSYGAALETDIGGYLDVGFKCSGGGSPGGQPTLAIGDYYALTGVQLEAGGVSTIFDRRPPSVEFQLCQRYYQKSNDTTNNYTLIPGSYIGSNGVTAYGSVPLQTPLRITPTVTFSNLALANGGTGIALTGVAVQGLNNQGVSVLFSTASGLTGGTAYFLQQNNSTAGYLAFSSEL